MAEILDPQGRPEGSPGYNTGGSRANEAPIGKDELTLTKLAVFNEPVLMTSYTDANGNTYPVEWSQSNVPVSAFDEDTEEWVDTTILINTPVLAPEAATNGNIDSIMNDTYGAAYQYLLGTGEVDVNVVNIESYGRSMMKAAEDLGLDLMSSPTTTRWATNIANGKFVDEATTQADLDTMQRLADSGYGQISSLGTTTGDNRIRNDFDNYARVIIEGQPFETVESYRENAFRNLSMVNPSAALDMIESVPDADKGRYLDVFTGQMAAAGQQVDPYKITASLKGMEPENIGTIYQTMRDNLFKADTDSTLQQQQEAATFGLTRSSVRIPGAASGGGGAGELQVNQNKKQDVAWNNLVKKAQQLGGQQAGGEKQRKVSI